MARSLDKTPNYRFDASCSQNSESDRGTGNSRFESTRHQNDSCLVIEPSVEHSRKLKINAYPGFSVADPGFVIRGGTRAKRKLLTTPLKLALNES